MVVVLAKRFPVFSNNLSIYVFSVVLLIGCGSSTPENSEQPSKDIIEDVTPQEPPVTYEDVECNGLARLDLSQASASEAVDGYPASNVIDKSFIATSRWSASKLDQSLILTLEAAALIKGISVTWFNENSLSYSYDVEVSQDQLTWTPVLTSVMSDSSTTRGEFISISESSAAYIKIITRGNSQDESSHIVEVEAFGCQQDTASSIELDDWYLSIPVDEGTNSKAESIKEEALANDYFNAEFFFLNSSGGLVFRAPIEGAKTSANTSYTRTELREMLRRGDTSISTQGINDNNWVFSSAPIQEQQSAGGVDGELFAELAVNYVTTTGDSAQVGRVIIGQIHANDDEPIRVYYRKLPNNDKGAIYLAHEILGGDDVYYELIGTRSKSADNPENGIRLNERFSYKISVVGNQLTFTLSRAQQPDVVEVIDMSASGYDLGGQYMYFKAGVYNQNNTGDPKDYVQATFYQINNTHSSY